MRAPHRGLPGSSLAVPAAPYLAAVWAGGSSSAGWAVPMATDIAFALAVLTVLSTHLPTPAVESHRYTIMSCA